MVVEISTLTFPILSVFSLHISQFIAIIVAIGNYRAEQTNPIHLLLRRIHVYSSPIGPNRFIIMTNMGP